MTRKICFITGSRAEYGLLRKLIIASQQDKLINMQVIVTGSHLSKKHGHTYKEIEKDHIQISSKVNLNFKGDSPEDIIYSMSIGLKGFSSSLKKLEPDLIVILGDRYEIFAAATAAMIKNIPIAHIHGGEVTEGAYDEAIRHSISKMAHMHFVAAPEYRKRVIQLGENPKSVFTVGGLGVDAINDLSLLDKKTLEKSMNFKFGQRNLLVTLHPETLEKKQQQLQNVKSLLAALRNTNETNFIFTMPNADHFNEQITNLIQEFCLKNSKNCSLFSSLGQLKYFSALQYVDGVIGNSSSGLLEVPSFKKGTINLGSRQDGRLKAISVIDCDFDKNNILKAVKKLYSKTFQAKIPLSKNPYGAPGASLKIHNIISTISLDSVLQKKFYDL
jgi:GDP/UDP-N,N'-diacetylbacillosamine 2-epimerase (hydrolysing)